MPTAPLSRRLLLRGAGASIALPMLEAMAPRRARAQTSPLRFMAWFHTSGAIPEDWVPTGEGAAFALSPILAPLGALKSQILVLSDMDLAPGGKGLPGSHDNQIAVLTSTGAIQAGVTDSADQIIAAKIGAQSRFPSLALSIEQNTFYDPSRDANGDGFKDSPTPQFDDTRDYCEDNGCRIAYAKGRTIPNLYNPRTVFEKLVGAGAMPGGAIDPAAAAAARKRDLLRKSVLDAVGGDARKLQGALGSADRIRLDEYLEGIRRLERTLITTAPSPVAAPPTPAVGCSQGAKPAGIPVDPERTARLMADLTIKAFECDATRVVTLMLGQGLSAMKFVVDGVTYAHHNDASHHGGDPRKKAAKTFIDRWQVSQLAYFLGELQRRPEGSGTMLDNVVVYYSSEIAEPQGHGTANLPVLIAGRGGGRLKQGRHVKLTGRFAGEALFTLMREVFQIDLPTFGTFNPKPLVGLT